MSCLSMIFAVADPVVIITYSSPAEVHECLDRAVQADNLVQIPPQGNI